MDRKEFFHKCAIAALPEVMNNYRKTEVCIIDYDMDDSHVERITSQAYNIAKHMLKKYDWNEDYPDENNKD